MAPRSVYVGKVQPGWLLSTIRGTLNRFTCYRQTALGVIFYLMSYMYVCSVIILFVDVQIPDSIVSYLYIFPLQLSRW